MNDFRLPDYNLEPPEDDRRKVYTCELCEDDIYEDEEYYDVPGAGKCCANCIEGSRRYAEVEDFIDEERNIDLWEEEVDADV